jgi:hypothetical protein
MDRIYAKAQLTIIAAAGSDPNYGLPGVGSRPRCSERHVRIGKTKLVQLMRPGVDFPTSPWWKRAWTYQEGILSRRKLVFTDHQVYYLCKQVHTAESLKIHADGGLRRKSASFLNRILFNEIMFTRHSTSYEGHISDISRRALSHPSDSLNVCLGILRATQTYHIWGVPITYFSWRHAGIAICWHHKIMAKRRHGFPSWSWVGWKGGVNLQNSIADSPMTTVLLGDAKDNWETVDDYSSSFRAFHLAGSSSAPKLLKITGSVLEANWLRDQWPDDIDVGNEDDRPRQRYLFFIREIRVLAVLYMDQEIGNGDQLYNVIAMGVRSGSDDCCITALLLKPYGKIYTRVGMMKLSCETSCRSTSGYHEFWKRGARIRTVVVG